MLFSSFSKAPREPASVVPIKPLSRRRFFTALAGGGTLALLGGLALKSDSTNGIQLSSQTVQNSPASKKHWPASRGF